MTLFQKAQRKKAKLRLALCSPSGGGKTHSALLIASGITKGNIFVIDTEKGSTLLEQGKPGIPGFFHAELTLPFSPARYCEFINTAVREGADCIIIDSLTGTGKTYLACALAQKACREGHTVQYIRIPRIFQELHIAKGDRRYGKILKDYPGKCGNDHIRS